MQAHVLERLGKREKVPEGTVTNDLVGAGKSLPSGLDGIKVHECETGRVGSLAGDVDASDDTTVAEDLLQLLLGHSQGQITDINSLGL